MVKVNKDILKTHLILWAARIAIVGLIVAVFSMASPVLADYFSGYSTYQSIGTDSITSFLTIGTSDSSSYQIINSHWPIVNYYIGLKPAILIIPSLLLLAALVGSAWLIYNSTREKNIKFVMVGILGVLLSVSMFVYIMAAWGNLLAL